MSYIDVEESSGQRISGFMFAVVLHVIVGYAMVNGLARRIIEVVQAPLETKIIEEIRPPPVEKPPVPQLPKFAAPPPPYIPAPEVRIDVPVLSSSAISAVSSTKPAFEAPVPRPAVPSASSGPVRTAAVVDSSACARPEYPPASLRAGDEGTVVLLFLIGLDGIATESRVEKSSGVRRLDEAARRALALCKFKPGTESGKAVQSWARIDYKWQIQDAQ